MIDYAAEYGIDMNVLHREHPAHPRQVRAHREHEARAARYWELQERIADVSEARIGVLLEKARVAQAKALEQKLFPVAEPVTLPVTSHVTEQVTREVRRVKKNATRHGAYKFTPEQLLQANLAYDRREAEGTGLTA